MDRLNEMKVGALVLAAVVLLSVLVLVIGDFKFESGQTVQVDYVFVGSLQTGAAVRTSGIKVGKVEAIDFMGGQKNPKTGEPIQIRLTLWIENRAVNQVRENSTFLINTEGVLGEQYVEIIPGTAEAPLLAPGAVIRGEDPPRTDLLMQKAFQLIDSMNNLMGDGDKFQDIIKSLGRLLETTDSLLTKNKDQIAPLLGNLNKLVVEMHSAMSATGDIRAVLENTKVITTELRRDIVPMTKDMRQAVGDFKLVGTNMIYLTDPQTGLFPRTMVHLDDSISKFERSLTGIDDGIAHFDRTMVGINRAASKMEHVLGRVELGPARHFLGGDAAPAATPAVAPAEGAAPVPAASAK